MKALLFRRRWPSPVLALLVALTSAHCAQPGGAGDVAAFEHDLAAGPTPWSHTNFDVGEGGDHVCVMDESSWRRFAVGSTYTATLRVMDGSLVCDSLQGD